MNLLLLSALAFVGACEGFVTSKKAKERQQEDASKEHTLIPPTCASEIYCQGKLLHTIQMAHLFNDSKHFVDMTMLHDEETILTDFQTFMQDHNQQPTALQVREFVQQNFNFSEELEMWTPPDFSAQPPILEQITDCRMREFASKLINIWPQLGRRLTQDTLTNIRRHSLMPLTEGFIIPGGRFRETYYWDTYWIIKGLLISNMPQTVRGMLSNFVTLIKQYGFIPNGARVYYAQRSQPPLFALMAYEYFKATNDRKWLAENIEAIEQEVTFWFSKHMVRVTIKEREYQVARYYAESLGPRPESYREDFLTAASLPTAEAQQELYTNLKSGAESGWDFSSRWFYDDQGGNNANLSQINMKRTIPVDLNSFLFKACHSLSTMYSTLDRLDEAAYWLDKAITLRSAIRGVLFNENEGIWNDYDTELQRHRPYFYVSNLTPLWVHAEHSTFDAQRLINKLIGDKVFSYVGGTPATLQASGEQWDLPNAWPPLQAIIIQSLSHVGLDQAKDIARDLAIQWLKANIVGFERTGYMFEKYDANELGQYGGGGEYVVQSGFGWTNGLALELVRDYYSNASRLY